jgi:hypothetical protein
MKINWPQATAEVALLLLGIGIALAADDWLEETRERQEEQKYLASLEADYQVTRDNLLRAKEFRERNNESTNQLLDMLLAGTLEGDDDHIADLIIRAHYVATPAAVFGTYYDMVNSGDLRLLRDEELRLKLAHFESRWSEYYRFVAESLDQWNLIQVPHMIQNLDIASIWSGRYDAEAFPARNRAIPRDDLDSMEFANVLAVKLVSDADIARLDNQLLLEIDEILALLRRAKDGSAIDDA